MRMLKPLTDEQVCNIYLVLGLGYAHVYLYGRKSRANFCMFLPINSATLLHYRNNTAQHRASIDSHASLLQ